MKSYLALAWKELKAQKITAILILVAVIMSTIMTTVIGQSIAIHAYSAGGGSERKPLCNLSSAWQGTSAKAA